MEGIMPDNEPVVAPFRTFAWRVVSLHMISYCLLGVAAFFLLNYEQAYLTTELRHLMLPTDSPWVAAGPALQVFRGLLFAVVLFPLAPVFLTRRHGTMILWGLFVGLAILGTAGPSPGSMEGMIYTRLPMPLHLFGLPEVLLQTLLFSAGLVAWYRRPSRWKNAAAGIAVGLIVLSSLAGVLLGGQ
jgi:hypothetical protein